MGDDAGIDCGTSCSATVSDAPPSRTSCPWCPIARRLGGNRGSSLYRFSGSGRAHGGIQRGFSADASARVSRKPVAAGDPGNRWDRCDAVIREHGSQIWLPSRQAGLVIGVRGIACAVFGAGIAGGDVLGVDWCNGSREAAKHGMWRAQSHLPCSHRSVGRAVHHIAHRLRDPSVV